MSSKRTIVTISGVTLILVIALFLVYYFFFTFRVTSVTPSLRSYTNITPSMTVSFNRPLQNVSSVESEPVNVIGDITFDESSITINLRDLEVGEPVTLTLHDVTSDDGYIIHSHTLKFTSKAANFDKLSDDEQNNILEQQEQTNQMIADPVLTVLPQSTADYAIEAVSIGTDASTGKDIYKIRITLTLSAADVRIDRDEAVTRYKKAAMDYLKSTELDLSNYDITTTVNEPSLY